MKRITFDFSVCKSVNKALASFKNKTSTCFNNFLPSDFKNGCFKNIIPQKLQIIFKNFNSKRKKYCDLNMTISNHFYRIREEYPDLDAQVRGILISRAQEGATIEEIRMDYYNLIGEKFPVEENVTDYLLSIPYVVTFSDDKGTRIFNVIPSNKNIHLYHMVLNQKPKDSRQTVKHEYIEKVPRKEKSSSRSDLSEGFHEMNCYEDNLKYLHTRFGSRESVNNQNQHVDYYFQTVKEAEMERVPYKPRTSTPTGTKTSQEHDLLTGSETKYDANFCDFQLLGDDFLLYLARMELKCKFRRGQKVLQSGYCVSGQTIKEATRRVRTSPYISPKMIINIGSVDILLGSSLVQIEYDFNQLLSALYSRNVTPILTTLAPLANTGHSPTMKRTLERFNNYIRGKRNDYVVIDIWKSMVSEGGNTRFDCYQMQPRKVTGTSRPHVFWNKIGRQRILQHIEREIEL